MAFVLVACRESNRARARLLAAKLVAKRVEVCSGLEQASAELRAGAYQAAIDHGALMVALWSDDDHADPAYVDHMLYAQRDGRLFAVAVGDARLPGLVGGDDGVAGVFDDNNPQKLDALLEAIAQRISAASGAQNDLDSLAPGSVAEETKAFLRLQRRRSANALAGFLRGYPEGVFEQVVRDQLDAETRPRYQSDQPIGNRWLDAVGKRLSFKGADSSRPHEEQLAKRVWRMETSPWSAARDLGAFLARQARSPAGAVIAGLILLGALAFVGVRLVHWPQSRPPASTIAIAPRDAYADARTPSITASPLPGSTSTSASGGDVGRPVGGSVDALRGPAPNAVEDPPPRVAAHAAEFSSAQAPAVEPPPAFASASAGRINAGQVQPNPVPTENSAEGDARAIQLARRQDTVAGYNAYLAAFPAGAFSSEARTARDRLQNGPPAFDLAQLEPTARAFVERARARETGANAGAAQSRNTIAITRPGAGDGNYRGATASGVASGLGKAVWRNGDAYAGTWSGSLPNGFGVLRLANGSRYEGEFVGGAPTGRGVFWNEDGRRLVGDRLFAALVSARSQ